MSTIYKVIFKDYTATVTADNEDEALSCAVDEAYERNFALVEEVDGETLLNALQTFNRKPSVVAEEEVTTEILGAK